MAEGAILDCVNQHEKVLEETTFTNLLVQACRLYCESDYIRTALKALGYFTYRITMAFLNCVERCDQNQLIVIIKKLPDDLLQGKMDTLEYCPLHPCENGNYAANHSLGSSEREQNVQRSFRWDSYAVCRGILGVI